MRGVTISAGYGTGGRVIARLVAETLRLPLLDRAISTEIAAKLQVSLAEAEGASFTRSRIDRFLQLLAPLAGGVLGAGTDAAPPEATPAPDDAELFREHAEAIMRQALETGAVILGRGGAAAFHDQPDVLRVRLFGSRHARIAHAVRAQSIDIATAERRLSEVDNARAHYVRRLYNVDIDNPELFDLQINSTVLTPDACADVIATAYRALTSP
jgi:cytidylate kinase